MNNYDPKEPNDLVQTAAHWAMRMHEDITPAEREQFQQWLLAHESHAREFRAHVSVLALTSALPAAAHARLSESVDGESNATPVSRRRVWVASLAASLLVALTAGGWFFARSSGLFAEAYVTHTGENRSVTFDDGSVAYLNTRTRLEWMGGKRDRRVRLVEGEALFDVVHDPAHPFRLLLDNSEIQVIGTRFDVYRKKSGEVVVTVLEGAVEVRDLNQGWKRQLTANQRIAYQPIGLTQDVQETTALNAAKWRDGVLEIEDESLPTVLDELSRYTDKRILLRDPRLAQMRIVGAVSVRDVGAALKRIEKLGPVVVAEHGNTFTLDYRPKPGDPQLR